MRGGIRKRWLREGRWENGEMANSSLFPIWLFLSPLIKNLGGDKEKNETNENKKRSNVWHNRSNGKRNAVSINANGKRK